MYLFIAKEAAKEDIRIDLAIHCLETSRDYADAEWTNHDHVTIPAGSRTATYTLNYYYYEDDYEWRHLERQMHVLNDSIIEITNL